METENKFIWMLQQANALYIQAEDMEKSGDYEMAKSFYQQTSAIFDEMKSSTDIFKQDDSAKSMELIATSCKRKIRILELKQTLIPKTKVCKYYKSYRNLQTLSQKMKLSKKSIWIKVW